MRGASTARCILAQAWMSGKAQLFRAMSEAGIRVLIWSY